MLNENTQVLENYLSLRKIAKSTEYVYTYALQSWDDTTKTPVQDLDKDSVIKWFKEFGSDKSPNTIDKYANCLKTFYAYTLEQKGVSKRKAKAEAQDVFDHLPLRDLRTQAKKENKLKDKVVTPREFQTLMDSTNNPLIKALIAVTYESGCRKGEIYSLKLKDVSTHQDHWTLTVEGKTGTRTVPIVKSIPYLRAWLQHHPDRDNEDQHLFTRIRNGSLQELHDGYFYGNLQYLCEKAGLRRIHPHMLRHTRLTKLAEDGLGEFQMKSFAGWTADSGMAARYVHLSGRGHVNAVLETEGMEVEPGSRESKPLIELTRCPGCDRQVDPDMITCPYCNFILDEKLGINRGDRVNELETRLQEQNAKLEEMERDLEVINVLFNHPKTGPEVLRLLKELEQETG